MTGRPAEPSTVAGYLAEVAAGLHGPRRCRRAILAELEDGLAQAVAEHRAAGLSPQRAAHAAIEQFGPAPAVVAGFAAELAIAGARRALVLFVVTGPLVGICWLALLDALPWRRGPTPLLTVPVLPLVAAAAVIAVGALASTGRLARWIPESGAGAALLATSAVAVLALLADTVLIGSYVWTSGAQPAAAAALAASAGRILCSAAAVRATLTTRGRLRCRERAA